MNLRVAIRLGIQYTLARGGLWVLRGIVFALAIYAMLEGGPHQLVRVIGLGLLLFVLQKGLTRRVSEWLDRKFFRESYNAERLPGELSEEARLFTETGLLLETVTNRVANTLHIPKASVLLRDGENYCLANTSGGFDPVVRCLPSGAKAVEHVRISRRPALIYFDDRDSWVQQIGPEEKRRLQALDAQILLPLSGREALAVVMVPAPKLSEEPYSGADLRLLQSVASQTGLALENSELLARLSAEAARRERLNRISKSPVKCSSGCFPRAIRGWKGSIITAIAGRRWVSEAIATILFNCATGSSDSLSETSRARVSRPLCLCRACRLPCAGRRWPGYPISRRRCGISIR